MEARLMYMAVGLDSSLTDVLADFRGLIVWARMAYPEILHLDVRDDRGETWRFATQDASWHPTDPRELEGLTIESATIDKATGELRCGLSNNSEFIVTPEPQVEDDDPPNWELFTPGRYMLEVGPGASWQVVDATDP
jgi:hypothetical protein